MKKLFFLIMTLMFVALMAPTTSGTDLPKNKGSSSVSLLNQSSMPGIYVVFADENAKVLNLLVTGKKSENSCFSSPTMQMQVKVKKHFAELNSTMMLPKAILSEATLTTGIEKNIPPLIVMRSILSIKLPPTSMLQPGPTTVKLWPTSGISLVVNTIPAKPLTLKPGPTMELILPISEMTSSPAVS